MGDDAGQAIVVWITAPASIAAALARSIVEARLAACVATTPIRSVYRWKGELHDDEEVQLAVKTTRHRFDELRAHVRHHHTYELPEILALPLIDGDADYLAWLRAETARVG